MLTVSAYLPIVVWLLFVTIANYASWRIPSWLAFIAFFSFTAVNILINGLLPGALAASCAFLLGLILAYANVTTRETTILLTVAFASLPITQWWVLLPGLFIAVAVSAYRIRKVAGAGYLSMIAGETYAGIGMQGSILTGQKPDLSRIPLLPSSQDTSVEAETDEKISEDTLLGSVGKVKIRLAPYLLAGALLIAAISVFLPYNNL